MAESRTSTGSPMQTAPRKSAVALWLTCIAGAADAIGYLVLRRIYVANMSGNTIAVGRALAESRWEEALIRISPVVAFLLGLVLTAVWLEVGRARGAPRRLAVVLALELLLLAFFGLVAVKDAEGARFIALVFIAAGAMGLQNAMLTRVGSLAFRTTHVTGTLSRFSHALAQFLVRRGDPRQRARAGRAARFYAALWLVYAMGALVGSWLEDRHGPRAMLAAAAALVLALAAEWIWPTPAP